MSGRDDRDERPSTLWWRPVPDGYRLENSALSGAIANRMRRSGGGSFIMTCGEEDMAYLDALSDAGVDGAAALRDQLKRHGRIKFFRHREAGTP